MTKKTLTTDLASMSTEDLLTLHRVSKELLIEKCGEDIPAFVYTTIYDRLRFSPRFNYEQLELLRPWINLKPTQRKEFKKAWLQALESFVDRGFKDNENLRNLVLDLVLSSKLLYKPVLPLIIESLEKITYLYDASYPNLRSSGAEWLIMEQLSNGN